MKLPVFEKTGWEKPNPIKEATIQFLNFMKKFDLKLDSIKEMLSKEQMKKITGGNSCFSGYCYGSNYWYCFDNTDSAGVVMASCTSTNPWIPNNDGLFLYYSDPLGFGEDRYCTPNYCSF